MTFLMICMIPVVAFAIIIPVFIIWPDYKKRHKLWHST
jgi:hypothetical protein